MTQFGEIIIGDYESHVEFTARDEDKIFRSASNESHSAELGETQSLRLNAILFSSFNM